MKRFVKILFPLFLLVSSSGLLATCCDIGCCERFCEMDWDTACQECCKMGRPFFAVRPQNWNLARSTVGWQPMAYEYGKTDWSAAFAITPEYTRSLKPLRVAKYFFGDDLKECGRLLISGSRKGYPNYEARDEGEWLADYFGLAPDFQSVVRFAPRAYNFITELSVHLAMDGFREGIFLDITAPIVYASRAMNMCESFTGCETSSGTLGFDAGYMGEKAIGHDSLPADFTSAISGTYMWGDLVEPLKYGKISTRKRSVLRLADLRIALGCNLMRGDDYQCALTGFLSIPTGNVPCADYLFEPVAGNGGHLELGVGANCYMKLWQDMEQERTIGLYCDARLAHLFKATQWRSFDLKNNPNSRYMLIQEMKSPSENLYAFVAPDTYPAPDQQYNGRLFHLIDKTTCCTDVSIDLQGEFAVTMKYTHGNFAFDLGYNFWGRTGEKFCPGCTLKKDKYALKGDAFIIGFRESNGDPTPVSATESKATINAGTNTPIGTAYQGTQTENPSIDNPYNAHYNNITLEKITAVSGGFTEQRTSYQPVLLSSDDLDTCESPTAISHKIFGHLNYAWTGRESGNIPFLGVGGEIEFAGKMDCSYSTLSQWGIWVKGGIEFE